MKKSYSLTPEEEAIMRGEYPYEEKEPDKSPDPGEDPKPEEDTPPPRNKNKRGLKAIFPVLIALAMMVGIAYLFIYLIHGPSPSERVQAREAGLHEIAISGEQKVVFREKIGLTEEESAAFWPVYIRFCKEMKEIRENHRKWLEKQGESPFQEIDYQDFIDTYNSDLEQLKNTITRFGEAFAALLGEERVPAVFILYEEWQEKNAS